MTDVFVIVGRFRPKAFLVNVCILGRWVCLSLKIKYLFKFYCNLYDVPLKEKCSRVYRKFTKFFLLIIEHFKT